MSETDYGAAVSTRLPVIVGYKDVDQQISIPTYLAAPSFRDQYGNQSLASRITGGSPTIDIRRVAENQPDYRTQEELLEEMRNRMAQQPEEYDELDELLLDTRFNSWEEFFDSASRQNTPWREYLTFRAGLGEGRGRGGGGGGPTSSVTLTNEAVAGAQLDATFTQYLGRTASDDEVQTYQKLLNAQERANPLRRTNGANNVTSGGFDPTRFAREYAQSQEGYAERFAAVNFMSALDKALANRGTALEEFAKGQQ